MCSLASRARPLGAGGEAAAPWNGAAAPGLAWQRCGGGGSCAAGSGWHRPGLAGAGAAAQPSVGSVALSLSVAVRPGRQALGVLWAAGRPRGPAVIAVLEQLTVAAVSVETVAFRLTWLTCLLLDQKARPYFQPSQRILEAHLSNFLVALLQGALAADCASLNLTSY